jgi:long-subunit acyl-CoA synthetase (AMP-forming)
MGHFLSRRIAGGSGSRPILNDFTPEQMKNIIEHSGARLILASRKLQPKIAPAVAETSEGRVVIGIEDFARVAGPRASSASSTRKNVRPGQLGE